MSRNTQVPAGAALERYATSEVVKVDDAEARLIVALWEGNYSQGYKSDYDRIATRWLVIEVRSLAGKLLGYPPRYKGAYFEPRRQCKQYSGARYAKAVRDFELICKRDHYSEPGPAEARWYYIRTHAA